MADLTRYVTFYELQKPSKKGTWWWPWAAQTEGQAWTWVPIRMIGFEEQLTEDELTNLSSGRSCLLPRPPSFPRGPSL